MSQLFTPAPALPTIYPSANHVADAREAQAKLVVGSLKYRLAILKRARHLIAANAREVAETVGSSDTSRSVADTLAAEVLPLLEAMRFLEREAASILRPTKPGKRGQPFWLRGVEAEVQRVPLGVVLIIGPSNYPLFLPGVQCLQALAAGNAVLWKPAAGGSRAARALLRILTQAGLPDGLLQVLDESPRAGIDAIRAGVDKVFVTGHAETGRAVMLELAETRTPSVMELSGCDAVFLLDGADLERVVSALVFGLRLNGSATCMAPRRVFATKAMIKAVLAKLLPKLAEVERVTIAPHMRAVLDEALLDVQQGGGTIRREGRLAGTDRVSPIVVTGAVPGAQILRTDIFAPVLTFCAVTSEDEAVAANAECPYALTAAIFGPELAGQRLGRRLRVGTVLINDLIVATADPRMPFGGRGGSGFGVTRGREGLLEMTAVKSVLTQRNGSLRAYAATTRKHEALFTAYMEAVHGGSIRARLRGLRRLFAAAKQIGGE